ncbi:MAG: hypothetical protein HQL06_06215 [Nitrospirae bacterium]|nr:hypothetical protein [Nitrospirota bacterium]
MKMIVLYDYPASKEIHRELFYLDDSVYISAGQDLAGYLRDMEVQGSASIALAVQWRGLVSLALWKSDASKEEIAAFLLSVIPECREILSSCSVEEVFERLYSEKRFDCLRRLSNSTKRLIDKHLKDKRLKIEVHLVSEAAGNIITSSL